MLKLKTQLDIVKYSLWVQKCIRKGAARGRRSSSVNVGPPNISEIERARKLKLKTPLDIATYSFLVQKKFPLRGVQGAHSP